MKLAAKRMTFVDFTRLTRPPLMAVCVVRVPTGSGLANTLELPAALESRRCCFLKASSHPVGQRRERESSSSDQQRKKGCENQAQLIKRQTLIVHTGILCAHKRAHARTRARTHKHTSLVCGSISKSQITHNNREAPASSAEQGSSLPVRKQLVMGSVGEMGSGLQQRPA